MLFQVLRALPVQGCECLGLYSGAEGAAKLPVEWMVNKGEAGGQRGWGDSQLSGLVGR
jgi:hypothetical protein